MEILSFARGICPAGFSKAASLTAGVSEPRWPLPPAHAGPAAAEANIRETAGISQNRIFFMFLPPSKVIIAYYHLFFGGPHHEIFFPAMKIRSGGPEDKRQENHGSEL
jgi:hypothetical protein